MVKSKVVKNGQLYPRISNFTTNLNIPEVSSSNTASFGHPWKSYLTCHFSIGKQTFYWQCTTFRKLVQWPWCYCAWLASKLVWHEPHRESMRYCQEEDERPNDADDLKATIKASWASITPEQYHRLISLMPRCIDAIIHGKRRPKQVLSAEKWTYL